jgi:hypothetical protein
MDDSTHGQANSELTFHVLRAVRRRRGECNFEEILEECASYPEKQVLSEIGRLSRTGDLRVVYKQGGDYAVRLPKAA